MLADTLQDKAVQYVSREMPPAEREDFEILLQARPELRVLVGELQAVAASLTLAAVATMPEPPAALKTRILAATDLAILPDEPPGLVVTDAQGLVEWVNPAFTAMCGYSLDELKGRKPGSLLQSQLTDPATVQRIRQALHQRQRCHETLLNYHKNGSPYWVDLRIAPIVDDNGTPLCFVARERKLPD